MPGSTCCRIHTSKFDSRLGWRGLGGRAGSLARDPRPRVESAARGPRPCRPPVAAIRAHSYTAWPLARSRSLSLPLSPSLALDLSACFSPPLSRSPSLSLSLSLFLALLFFSYRAGGLSLEFYWNVIWEVPASVRSACKVLIPGPRPHRVCAKEISRGAMSESCVCACLSVLLCTCAYPYSMGKEKEGMCDCVLVCGGCVCVLCCAVCVCVFATQGLYGLIIRV